MINVLGLELEQAKALIAREGFECKCVEVSSRKGVAGNEKRVIRVRQTGDNSIELVYSVFITDVELSQRENCDE